MNTIQAFLMWVLCDFVLVTAFIFLGLALAEEVTINAAVGVMQESSNPLGRTKF